MNSNLASEDDAVDVVIRQWAIEQPDLDTGPMATIGRLKRCSTLVHRRLEAAFAMHGLTAWEFDVLATLRRSGTPFRMAPTVLFSSLMVTSGTMTNRLQKLEQAGMVSRLANPDDARGLLVQLTPEGRLKIDAALHTHVQNEEEILKNFPADQREQLDDVLRKLLASLEK